VKERFEMTRQKTFKRKVRARMQKTGESYTAARRQLIAAGERPASDAPSFEPPMSAEAIRERTGRDWDGWFELVDAWNGANHSHTEIARWLREEQGVDGWSAQSITVAYERARGLRAPGQRPDGWSVTASKTIAVPVDRLFAAFDDERQRERWLPGAELHERTATAPRSARYDWEDGSTRVIVGFEAKDDGRSLVAVEHARLPDADTADEMKAFWRERVAALKEMLER
jgi:uncharacterized protein YndB with AHSA1/START domain